MKKDEKKRMYWVIHDQWCLLESLVTHMEYFVPKINKKLEDLKKEIDKLSD